MPLGLAPHPAQDPGTIVCPSCREEISATAIVCMFCRKRLVDLPPARASTAVSTDAALLPGGASGKEREAGTRPCPACGLPVGLKENRCPWCRARAGREVRAVPKWLLKLPVRPVLAGLLMLTGLVAAAGGLGDILLGTSVLTELGAALIGLPEWPSTLRFLGLLDLAVGAVLIVVAVGLWRRMEWARQAFLFLAALACLNWLCGLTVLVRNGEWAGLALALLRLGALALALYILAQQSFRE